MSARLPSDLAARSEVLADLIDSIAERWQTDGLGSDGALNELRLASHAIVRFRDEGLDGESPLEPLDAAIGYLDRAKGGGAAGDAELCDEARDELAELRRIAIERMPARPTGHAAAATSDQLPFRASRGSPTVRYGVAIPPVASLPEELEIDDQPDELDEAGTAADGVPPLAAPPSAALRQVRALGRELMEDLGVLGGLRRPLPDEAWTAPIIFEQRLLEQLDALFSLARTVDGTKLDLVDELYSYVSEWAVPDISRTFALAMTLSCVEGEASARWLFATLRTAHPRTHGAFEDALSLGPNSAIPAAIAARLGSSEPAHVLATLLEVARRRGDVQPASVAMLLAHPSPEVACAAARAALRLPRSTAITLLSDVMDDAGPLGFAAAETLATFGLPAGVLAMRRTLEALVGDTSDAAQAGGAGRFARALRVLACAGQAEDEQLVTAAAARRDDGWYWLGVYGRPAHAHLLAQEAQEGEKSQAARRGLERMLGGQWDVDVADLESDPEQRAHTERDWHERLEAASRQTGRMRSGEPHRGAISVIRELLAPETRACDRDDLAIELGMTTAGERFVAIDDWIPRQRATLELFASAIEKPRR